MASIRRQGRRCEIRECLVTERGPRQHMLVSCTGVLTPEVLGRAEACARRPFDRAKVVARARTLGVPVTQRRLFPEARVLLGALQRGAGLDPRLVTLLRAALELLPAAPVPEHLAEAAEWIGQPEAERGRALRGLLRTAGRILRSRGPLPAPPRASFPRFSSEAREVS